MNTYVVNKSMAAAGTKKLQDTTILSAIRFYGIVVSGSNNSSSSCGGGGGGGDGVSGYTAKCDSDITTTL